MKKFVTLLLVCTSVILAAAEKNLVPLRGSIYGKNSSTHGTVISKDGVIDSFISGDAKVYTGSVSTLVFEKPLTGSITFGGESKAENVKGAAANNYCIYLDITYSDGTKLYGKTAVFTPGTHDWEKKTTTVKLEKPVKLINFYVILRNVTGKASFRNIFLYNK